ncbi:hypothetical protein [Halobacteriovorax sp. HLS]|uniref:hypothetical protein n=1 Tax=Halobacteriovorax sp. HLS TaxID=2234000 RepID=UPI000FDB2313|nr:hypothetical protein [Halobacteriovorax sp. HLS]
MKKKINNAVTRRLDKSFDKKFWNRFEQKFPKSVQEQNWQRIFTPLAMVTVLIVLTINLYSNDPNYTQAEINEYLQQMQEIEKIVDSVNAELETEYYALID